MKISKRVIQRRSQMERPLHSCSYPLTAKYKGSGSIDDAGNFVCARAQGYRAYLDPDGFQFRMSVMGEGVASFVVVLTRKR